MHDARTRSGTDAVILDFTADRNVRVFLREGWSHSEASGTWTLGPSSTLSLPTGVGERPPAGRWRLRLELVPFVWPPYLPRQRLRVEVNAATVGTFEFTSPDQASVEVFFPARLLRAGEENRIRFVHPDWAKPSTVPDAPDDDRRLALRFLKLQLTEEYAPPTTNVPLLVLQFSAGGNAAPFLREGWSFEEDWGRWSEADRCVLALPPAAIVEPMQLVLCATPVSVPFRIGLSLNGRPLEIPALMQPGPNIIICPVPSGTLRGDGPARLVLDLPDGHHVPGDSRRLGLSVLALALEHQQPAGEHCLTPSAFGRMEQLVREYRSRCDAGFAVLEAGEPAEALLLADALVRDFPDGMFSHRLRARSLAALLREQEAMESLSRAAAIASTDVEDNFVLGLMNVEWGRYAEAASRLEAIIPHRPDWMEPVHALALCYQRLNWLDRAMACARRLEANGMVPADWLRIAAAIRTAFEQARQRVRDSRQDMIQDRLGDAEIVGLARDLCAIGRPRTAIRLLSACPPRLPGKCVELVRAVWRAQSLESAILTAAAPAALGVTSRQYAALRAGLAYEAGRFAEAETLFAYAERDDAPDLTDMRCRTLFLLGRHADLVAAARRWMAAEPLNSLAGQWALSGLLAGGDPLLHHRIPEAREAAHGFPRLIFQYWNTPEIPGEVAELMERWRSENPEFDYVRFDRDDARRFLMHHVGADVLEAFDHAHHPAMESDLIRLAFLQVNGGVYVDADEFCRQSLETVLHGLAGFRVVVSLSRVLPFYANNWFIAAVPGEELIGTALHEATRLVLASKRSGERADIWQVTGPGLLTRVLARACLAEDGAGGVYGQVAMLSGTCYARMAGEQTQLAYKRNAAGNWRLAGSG